MAVFDEHARALAREYLEVVGETLVDYLQEKLGEKSSDTRRSGPGEYPARDTSSLQESIDAQTYVRGGKVFLKFGALNDVRLFSREASPTLYARILEHAMARKLTRAAWEECRANGLVDEALRKAGHRRRYYAGSVGEFIRSPGPATASPEYLTKIDAERTSEKWAKPNIKFLD